LVVVQIAKELHTNLKKYRPGSFEWNPFDMDIQPNNCAKQGLPTYFDVIEEPMNLVMIYVSAMTDV